MPRTASSAALVSPEWSQQHLDDPRVRFVEVDVDRAAYDVGHIPGAVYWDWSTELIDRVRRDLADHEALASLLSRSGIGAETQVVLYGEDNWYAAWAYWQLSLFGFTNASLVDGGREFWIANDLALTTDVPDHDDTDVVLPEADDSARIYGRDIAARLERDRLLPVDVREADEFAGEMTAPPGYPAIAQRAGHIPGAASVPWSTAVRPDGRFRSVEDLTALYAAAGVTSDREVFTYCGVGVRSSHTWFVLHELLGFPDVRNYDGSWAEWGSMVGVPIERDRP